MDLKDFCCTNIAFTLLNQKIYILMGENLLNNQMYDYWLFYPLFPSLIREEVNENELAKLVLKNHDKNYF